MRKRILGTVLSLALCVSGALPGIAAADVLGEKEADSGASTVEEDESVLSAKGDLEGARAAIIAGLKSCQTRISLSEYGITRNQAKALYQDIIDTNPSLFYVTSTNTIEFYYPIEVDKIGFKPEQYLAVSVTPVYIASGDDLEMMCDTYEDRILDAMSWVPDEATIPEKLKALHDWLCYNVAYDNEEFASAAESGSYGVVNKWAYNAYGAMVQGKAVCQGYVMAFGDLCDRLGIPWEFVRNKVTDFSGVSSNVFPHGWNAVEVDGNWFYVDVTWDDDDPAEVIVSANPKQDYFLKSGTVFASTHGACDFTKQTSSLYDDAAFPTYDKPLRPVVHVHAWRLSDGESETAVDYVVGRCRCGARAESFRYCDTGLWMLRVYNFPAVETGSLSFKDKAMLWDNQLNCWSTIISSKLTSLDSELAEDPLTEKRDLFPEGSLKGDLNENNKVNIVDVQIVYDCATGKYNEAGGSRMLLMGDINGDEFLDAADALALQRAIRKA